MKDDFNFDGIEGVRLGDPVHIHSYNTFSLEPKLVEANRLKIGIAG